MPGEARLSGLVAIYRTEGWVMAPCLATQKKNPITAGFQVAVAGESRINSNATETHA